MNWWPSDRVLLVLAGVWLAGNISTRWYPTPDSVGYLSVARELIETGQLRNLGSPHIYYPIGYPLLISPTFLLDPEPFVFISILHFALGLLLLLLVYRWVKVFFPQHAAWVAFLTVANTSFGHIYRRTLGETAFMVAWMLAGLAFQRLLQQGRGHLLAALSLIPLVLIRPAGAMLAGGVVVSLALAAWKKERPWRLVILWAFLLLPAALVQYAWMTRDKLAAESLGNPTYSEQFRDPSLSVTGQVVEGFRLRIQETGRLLMPGMLRSYAKTGQWLDFNMLVFLPISVAVVTGWLSAVRSVRDIHLWALPFYVGLYVLWPHDQTTRFFTPILPMLLVCLLFVVQKYPQERVRKAGIVFTCLHLGVAFGFWLIDERRHNIRLEQRLPELRIIAETIPVEERGSVGISATYHDENPQLSFYLNRHLWMWSPKKTSTIPDTVNWIVIHENDPPPPGFHPTSDRTPRLYHR